MRFLSLLSLLALAVLAATPAAAQTVETAGEEPTDTAAGIALAPRAFRAATAKVLPSLVTIESFGGVFGAGARAGRMQGISRPGDGPTTGMVISPDGTIVTSTFNFVKNPPVITVVTRDGRRHIAKLLGRDDTRGICLLKINPPEPLPAIEWADPAEVRVGQWALSVGVGFGDTEPAASVGIISAPGRFGGRALQTDANTSPANYGGPLVDIEGRVLGVCVPLSPQSDEAGSGVEWYDSGIGFAVPLHGASALLAALREGKSIRRARLGVVPGPDPNREGGCLIVRVQPGSAADKCGIEAGDRVIECDGEAVIDADHFRRLINRHVAGEELRVRLLRGEEELEFTAVLGEAVPEEEPAGEPEEEAPGEEETPKEQ